MRDWRGPKIIETMLADPNVDLLLCPITGALPSMANKLCEDLVAAAATTDKPLFVVWGSPVGTEEAYTKTLLGEHGAHLPHLHQRGHGRQGLLRPSPLRRLLPVGLRPPGCCVPPGRRRPPCPCWRPEASGGPAARASRNRTPRPCSSAYGIAVPKERVATSRRGGGQGGQEDRLPGRDEDRLAGHPAQVRPGAGGRRRPRRGRRPADLQAPRGHRQEGGAQGERRRCAGGRDGAGRRDRRRASPRTSSSVPS